MARPSKYTPERVKRILEALSAGVSRKTAAEYAGINETTLIAWMHRYPNFTSAVIGAETKVEVRASLSLRLAFEQGDWRAALEWLKRRRPNDWGETHRIEIINSVREMAKAAGKDEAAAVTEAELWLREQRARGTRSS